MVLRANADDAAVNLTMYNRTGDHYLLYTQSGFWQPLLQ
jgi:hypothetical protein